MATEPPSENNWDIQADVVVVGLGAVGFATSVTAYEAGAEVLILEKAPEGREGGNTRVAGQGYLNTSDPGQAADYLKALCGPFVVPDSMVQTWADEMGRNNDWLTGLGGDPQEHQHPPEGIEFPELPGADCVHKFHDGPTYGYSLTWKRFKSLVEARPIRIAYQTPARKAVVLTCGGFENNQEMIRNFLSNMPFCNTSGSPYNEGDGIKMAMSVGAGPLYDKTPRHGWTQVVEQYPWSDDNSAKLAKGWIQVAADIPGLAHHIALEPRALALTVQNWNASAAAGKDSEFGLTLMLAPIENPPYYAVELSPSMLNTQGGPRRDEKARIVRPDGTPIARLYSAGELGSIYSYLYQGTGNIGECLAFGRIAGRNAAAMSPWD